MSQYIGGKENNVCFDLSGQKAKKEKKKKAYLLKQGWSEFKGSRKLNHIKT